MTLHPALRTSLLAVSLLSATAIAAQSQSLSTLDASARRTVVESLTTSLNRLYVDADTGRMIANAISSHLKAGDYETISEPLRFADALTQDLRSVNGDRHLRVSWTAPAVPGTGNAPASAAPAISDHFGLGRVDVLPGNIGYMKVDAFEGSKRATEATLAALKYLETTDAMIFDFRGMRGGSPNQSNLLISHFTSADTTASLTVSNRSEGTKFTRYTLATVPGLRRATTPVWVLTNRGTASAGEDFSFVLQQLHRAVIVGDRTAGAGHNNTFVNLGNGYSASISITRVSDPRTGKEWERVGVQPDIKVNPADALSVAHLAALDSLGRLANQPVQRAALAMVTAGVKAAARAHTVAATTLASYTGTYEGDRIVSVENGALVFRREALRPPTTMVALDDTNFIINGMQRLSFEKGTTTNLVIHQPDGSVYKLPRIGGVPPDVAP